MGFLDKYNEGITSIDNFDVKNLRILYLENNQIKYINPKIIKQIKENNIDIDIDLDDFDKKGFLI